MVGVPSGNRGHSCPVKSTSSGERDVPWPIQNTPRHLVLSDPSVQSSIVHGPRLGPVHRKVLPV